MRGISDLHHEWKQSGVMAYPTSSTSLSVLFGGDMELAGLKVMMAGHSNTRTKLVCRKLLSLMLWALDLQLWPGSL